MAMLNNQRVYIYIISPFGCCRPYRSWVYIGCVSFGASRQSRELPRRSFLSFSNMSCICMVYIYIHRDRVSDIGREGEMERAMGELSTYLSICLSVYLSLYLSIFLSLYLSIYLSIYRSIDLSIYRSIDLSIYRSICLSIYLSIYPSIYPSIHLSIHLSIYRSIYLSFYLSIYSSIHLSIV